jgi:hypothetical protein
LKQYKDAKFQSQEIARAIGADLGWLESMRQAPALLRVLRGRYSSPNVHVRVSSRLVAVGINQNLDEIAPINENIQGTTVSGAGHGVGYLVAQLVPDGNEAMLETNASPETSR